VIRENPLNPCHPCAIQCKLDPPPHYTAANSDFLYLCTGFEDMGRIVAIDYGQKRVGLAVTDELKLIATSLGAVAAHDIIEFLKDYTIKNQVDCFVVGEPKQMNNTPSESVRFIDPFVKQLRKEFPGIPVERMDERFTSLMATRTIRDSGVNQKARRNKSLVDTVSATILLQSFLEYRQMNVSSSEIL
jgi:putative holliday junction resolvase